MSGFLGALGGLGQSMTSVGKSWSDELKQERIQQMKQDYDDKVYARSREDKKSDMELKREWDQEDAVTKRDWAREDADTAHRYKISEKTADDKKDSTLGGWKAKDAQKEANSLVAKGMGMDSDNFSFDEDKQETFGRLSTSTYDEFRKDPDSGMNAAYYRALKQEGIPDKEAARLAEVTSEVNKEIDEKTSWYSSDKSDLGMPRDEYRKKEVDKRMGSGGGMLSDPNAGATPPPRPAGFPSGPVPKAMEGKRVRGPDGKTYMVKGGEFWPSE